MIWVLVPLAFVFGALTVALYWRRVINHQLAVAEADLVVAKADRERARARLERIKRREGELLEGAQHARFGQVEPITPDPSHAQAIRDEVVRRTGVPERYLDPDAPGSAEAMRAVAGVSERARTSLTTDRSDPRLTRGSDTDPVPQAEAYLVLSEEERQKGFVRPFRDTYVHLVCGTETSMGREIAETYAREPGFYGGTYCVHCQKHRPVGAGGEFVWGDGSKVGT